MWFRRRKRGERAAQRSLIPSSTNQSIIYRLAPAARSRINSAYMVCYFAGGALGSAAASTVYDAAHWPGVCLLGAAIGLATTLLALTDTFRSPAG